eukprot:m.120661 g.120661  ORF g.120661 m.120661 type:complete len:81 (+) comp16510_c0_seq3:395-637(+)
MPGASMTVETTTSVLESPGGRNMGGITVLLRKAADNRRSRDFCFAPLSVTASCSPSSLASVVPKRLCLGEGGVCHSGSKK